MAQIEAIEVQSKYADLHQAEWIPANYDERIYDPKSYDAHVWEVYRPYLLHILGELGKARSDSKYLDFACGTGRILAEFEGLFAQAHGVDISPYMAAYAKRKVSAAVVKSGDVLADPELVDFNYDVISAFRFFLNTEPEMRSLIMRSLSARLADGNSRLVFNIHMNGWGADGLKNLYRVMRGWGAANTMTYGQVRNLVEEAGLEIEQWWGFCLWPDRLYSTRLAPALKWVDRWAARTQAVRAISKDLLFVCRPSAG